MGSILGSPILGNYQITSNDFVLIVLILIPCPWPVQRGCASELSVGRLGSGVWGCCSLRAYLEAHFEFESRAFEI